MTSVKESSSSLKFLLIPFFKALNNHSIPYCVCGNHEGLPEYTSHDVDLWTGNLKVTESLLNKIAHESGFCHYLRNGTANGSNNFFYKKTGTDYEIIRIDLMDECAWKSLIPIVRSETIGRSRIKYKDFFISNPAIQTAMHLLYPLLTKGEIRDKYKEKIFAFRDDELFRETINQALGKLNGIDLIKKISNRDWETIETKVAHYRRHSVLLTLAKINMNRCVRFITFFLINLHKLIKPSGLFIALIGLDGCGKTTILEKLNDFFNISFIAGKDKSFYWRPFFLPRIRYLLKLKNQKTSNCEINNHDYKLLKETYLHSILYLCKFLYYLVDFILGRVRYQGAWSRGGIVCFDRYYYDQLIYPQRFNFIVPRFIMSLCMQLVPKPEIVFFLDAPPELLYHRKRELSLEELNHQRKDYLNFIEKLKNCHKIDTTTAFKETLDTIITVCLKYMAKRIKLK